jgi:predicted  nucleic acid-binding Zn-ribbon protein
VDSQLQLLIDLQAIDTRIAGLETEAARLPKQIEAIQAVVATARKTVDDLKTRLDAARKNIRAKEKDLDVSAAKRTKAEARLYEVKTNREYSAALVEIEDIKQEKSGIEEEILALMETQERVAVEVKEAETRLRRVESDSQAEEATAREQFRGVEAALAAARGERATLVKGVPALLLGSYDRILKARGGLAIAQALALPPSFICAGCRVSIRPQAMQELRAQDQLLMCESCGRYLYWREPAGPNA